MKTEKFISLLGSEFSDQKIESLLRRSRRRVDGAIQRIRRPEAATGVVNSPLGDLLVALDRPDVFLPGDLALRRAIQRAPTDSTTYQRRMR